MTETPDMSVEIARRTRACWMRIGRYQRELYDQPKVVLSLKTRMVKAEAIEALLYGCSTWTLRMSGGRLPKRVMFGNLEGVVRRGRGGEEKEWTDCVQSDIRGFCITEDWKAMALKAEMWVEAITEGGRRVEVHGRVEKVRGRRGQTSPGEERGNEIGKVGIAHGSVEFCEATPNGLADESKESLYGRETDRDLRNADLRST